MLYLNTSDIQQLPLQWSEVVSCIESAVQTMPATDYAQPVKPYLRYNNLTNRIIAMPAYVGGNIGFSGIKWIASFPDNTRQGIPRAHSVTVLNEADTGIPCCIINSAVTSGIRTAGVSAFVLSKFLTYRQRSGLIAGITGFGPIGQLHLKMLLSLFGNNISAVRIFDLKPIEEALLKEWPDGKVTQVSSWEEAYMDADVFITCTVSSNRYINKPPKKGSVHLNVSLRDYEPDFVHHADMIIVDDWEEVCRENTDIEKMHQDKQLQKQDTVNLGALLNNSVWSRLSDDAVVMFNPMGMAIFDVAVASYYYRRSIAESAGTLLNY
ncbi:ornithine cyclodeaminase [Filimonas lacunae]|uniref:Ornithine cyclodeaminase n=1 Tax=Filimonas lacunae TaxID=477680 RepID=A0A173MEK0_9BACT|nr:2,3-diaminopropionate biosynthesis protein SbnB [Filimonas lacunae]BAV05926.1 ornithine cyclodeaminase [Filimonas lacunae]SIT34507.1 ornithine cyclodeaminase [Filimonas lacunae]